MSSAVSLPLKYRPERFEDLIGQETIARYLASLIKRGGIGKNLILSGAYGSGKSSSCRVYARALNCLQPTEAGSPCNTCDHCAAFFKQEFPDYLEVDGASSGRVDAIKNLVDFAKTPPMFGRKRVINIDEAQGVSRQAFDALLKIIEEPPPWLVFIFTTTELNKIREAIQSRCQKLQVKLLEHTVAVAHLEHVCKAEQLNYERPALELIAFLSKGHPRDLLTNLEQVTYLGDVTLENTKALFNLGYIVNLQRFWRALFDADYTAAREALRTWADNPATILDTLREFALYLSYTYVQHINVTLNPIFGFLPKGDVNAIFNAIRSRADRASISAEQAMGAITGALGKAQCHTPVALELLLNDLYALVHRQNFNVAAFGQPSADTTAAGPMRKTPGGGKPTGRRFAHNWNEQNRPGVAEAAPAPQTQSAPADTSSDDFAVEDAHEQRPSVPLPSEKEAKLYPHTLLGAGFSPQALGTVDVSMLADDQ